MLRALVLAFALAIVASPADAQLGALKKRAEKAVANKVAPQPTTARPTPAFDNVVVELTDARLGQMLAGFAAEEKTATKNREAEAGQKNRDAAYRREREKYERAMTDWEKRRASVNQCSKKYEPEMEARANRAQSMVERVDTMAMKAVALRIQNAQQRGDIAEARRLTDSLTAVMAAIGRQGNTSDIHARARAECGEAGEEPRAPEAPAQPASLSTLSDGSRAAGIPEEQYRIARERILAWLSLGDDKITRGETKYAFTDAELSALNGRRGELRRYETLLQTY
jgi:hypothetical protein